jgi:hypothetical protein
MAVGESEMESFYRRMIQGIGGRSSINKNLRKSADKQSVKSPYSAAFTEKKSPLLWALDSGGSLAYCPQI